MKIYLNLFIILILSLGFASLSAAIPTCTLRSGCEGGETCIFGVVQENSSHVGSCDASGYSKICCTEITAASVRSSCNADEGSIISMYQTSNAHAGSGTYYSNIVCAKTADTPVVTNIRATCLATENCVVSLFQEDNAHVGSCDYYSNKICIQELFNVTITIVLNNTSPNWGEAVNVQGNATRADGTAIDTSADPEDVEIYVNSTLKCTTDTDSNGAYSCDFNAPLAIGLYELNVTVDDPTTSKTWWNSTTFNVKQELGEERAAEEVAETIACYEEPRIVQNPDGTIEVAIVRICAWK